MAPDPLADRAALELPPDDVFDAPGLCAPLASALRDLTLVRHMAAVRIRRDVAHEAVPEELWS